MTAMLEAVGLILAAFVAVGIAGGCIYGSWRLFTLFTAPPGSRLVGSMEALVIGFGILIGAGYLFVLGFRVQGAAAGTTLGLILTGLSVLGYRRLPSAYQAEIRGTLALLKRAAPWFAIGLIWTAVGSLLAGSLNTYHPGQPLLNLAEILGTLVALCSVPMALLIKCFNWLTSDESNAQPKPTQPCSKPC